MIKQIPKIMEYPTHITLNSGTAMVYSTKEGIKQTLFDFQFIHSQYVEEMDGNGQLDEIGNSPFYYKKAVIIRTNTYTSYLALLKCVKATETTPQYDQYNFVSVFGEQASKIFNEYYRKVRDATDIEQTINTLSIGQELYAIKDDEVYKVKITAIEPYFEEGRLMTRIRTTSGFPLSIYDSHRKNPDRYTCIGKVTFLYPHFEDAKKILIKKLQNKIDESLIIIKANKEKITKILHEQAI